MEPQYTIYLHSNFSSSCKRFLNLLQECNTDLGLTSLCIDNSQIRERIQRSQNISVNQVPCILLIFADGVVEKYEGPHAFRWGEGMLSQIKAQQARQVQHMTQSQQIPSQQVSQQPVQVPQQQVPQQQVQVPQQVPQSNNGGMAGGMQERIAQDMEYQKKAKKKRPKMKPINQGVTSIENIPEDEEENEEAYVDDRHRNMRPIARIRRDPGNYEEDGKYFDTPQPEVKHVQTNAIRQIQKTTANDPSNLMAKAEAMRKSRSEIEQLKPQGEPIQNRP